MILHAFILITVNYMRNYTHGEIINYSLPMTEKSCLELKRNVDAISVKDNFPVSTRCVAVDLVK